MKGKENLQTAIATLFEPIENKWDADYVGGNAFGDALRSTSQLLVIMQSSFLSGKETTEPAGGNGAFTTSSTTRFSSLPLSPAGILNLLSSFLRLVTIFDYLLIRLLEKSHHTDGKGASSSPNPYSGSSPQTLPGLHLLADFPLHQRSLQIKILIQKILHQFEIIERILGLPVQLRISDRQDDYWTGLLHSDEIGSNLLKFMGGRLNLSTPRLSVPTSSLFPERNQSPVPGSLPSLRENIARLRQLAHMDI
ncbi:hypothetical protein DL762_002521 [Monosporascus cannonballus]|uniref:Uncharacterized protein n=1 Tax=Monosporascus cannonballus TaxID=155416 RepID=A0ABY0HHE5_9PEZI|nr:hypothetical protein DL762_002521 [Monosporascus cannonballus]RYO98208.1 hypothetical protein DL763_002375 [Monosporascus cannonballus]